MSDYEEIWRMPRVCSATGMSKNTLIRKVDAGLFPRPVRISEAMIGWYASEVVAWIKDRPRVGVRKDEAA